MSVNELLDLAAGRRPVKKATEETASVRVEEVVPEEYVSCLRGTILGSLYQARMALETLGDYRREVMMLEKFLEHMETEFTGSSAVEDLARGIPDDDDLDEAVEDYREQRKHTGPMVEFDEEEEKVHVEDPDGFDDQITAAIEASEDEEFSYEHKTVRNHPVVSGVTENDIDSRLTEILEEPDEEDYDEEEELDFFADPHNNGNGTG